MADLKFGHTEQAILGKKIPKEKESVENFHLKHRVMFSKCRHFWTHFVNNWHFCQHWVLASFTRKIVKWTKRKLKTLIVERLLWEISLWNCLIRCLICGSACYGNIIYMKSRRLKNDIEKCCCNWFCLGSHLKMIFGKNMLFCESYYDNMYFMKPFWNRISTPPQVLLHNLAKMRITNFH